MQLFLLAAGQILFCFSLDGRGLLKMSVEPILFSLSMTDLIGNHQNTNVPSRISFLTSCFSRLLLFSLTTKSKTVCLLFEQILTTKEFFNMANRLKFTAQSFLIIFSQLDNLRMRSSETLITRKKKSVIKFQLTTLYIK